MVRVFSSTGVWPNGIAIVRVFTGWFIYRYSQELFNIDGLLDFLAKENWPFPVFSGYAAKIIELVGGIFLMLGFLTKWVTPLLMITMAGVIITTAGGNIYQGEGAFLFFLLFAMFFLAGPGKWSVDHWLATRRERRLGKTDLHKS